MKPITDYFDTLQDDRLGCLIAYSLREILLSSLLCGAKDFDEIIDYSEEYLDWLRKYYPFKHGIACSVTYQRIFSGFDNKTFAACFAQFSHDLCGLEGEIVAIDGKALRGSKEETGKQGTKNGALYTVSAFACERGLTLGEESGRLKAMKRKILDIGASKSLNVGCQPRLAGSKTAILIGKTQIQLNENSSLLLSKLIIEKN